MTALRKWMAWFGATVGAAVFAVFVPAVAWASSDTGAFLVEEVRRRRWGFGFGYIAACCCLVFFVGVAALVVLLVRRGKR